MAAQSFVGPQAPGSGKKAMVFASDMAPLLSCVDGRDLQRRLRQRQTCCGNVNSAGRPHVAGTQDAPVLGAA